MIDSNVGLHERGRGFKWVCYSKAITENREAVLQVSIDFVDRRVERRTRQRY